MPTSSSDVPFSGDRIGIDKHNAVSSRVLHSYDHVNLCLLRASIDSIKQIKAQGLRSIAAGQDAQASRARIISSSDAKGEESVLAKTGIETLQRIDRSIVSILQRDPLLAARITRLRSIDGVGEITALTWVLEAGEPSRFPNSKHALPHCGLWHASHCHQP